MAKPTVWRAGIHLTDQIIVQLTFHRLITGAPDSISDFLSRRLCLFSHRRGDFLGLGERRMPMLIAHILAQLIDQLTCPLFPLLAQILTDPFSFNRWFSEENTRCFFFFLSFFLPAHHRGSFALFSLPGSLVNSIFRFHIKRRNRKSTHLLLSLLVRSLMLTLLV